MTRQTVTILPARTAGPAVLGIVHCPSAQDSAAASMTSAARTSVAVLKEPSQRASAVAQGALGLAKEGYGLFGALETCARAGGVKPNSDEFDDAAALVGLPYCRALDLYVDLETKRRAEQLGFAKAHQALIC